MANLNDGNDQPLEEGGVLTLDRFFGLIQATDGLTAEMSSLLMKFFSDKIISDSDTFKELMKSFEENLTFQGFEPMRMCKMIISLFKAKGRSDYLLTCAWMCSWILIHRGSRLSKIRKTISDKGAEIINEMLTIVNVLDTGKKLTKDSITIPRFVACFPCAALDVAFGTQGYYSDLHIKVLASDNLPLWASVPSLLSSTPNDESLKKFFNIIFAACSIYNFRLSATLAALDKNLKPANVELTKSVLTAGWNSKFLPDSVRLQQLVLHNVLTPLKMANFTSIDVYPQAEKLAYVPRYKGLKIGSTVYHLNGIFDLDPIRLSLQSIQMTGVDISNDLFETTMDVTPSPSDEIWYTFTVPPEKPVIKVPGSLKRASTSVERMTTRSTSSHSAESSHHMEP